MTGLVRQGFRGERAARLPRGDGGDPLGCRYVSRVSCPGTTASCTWSVFPIPARRKPPCFVPSTWPRPNNCGGRRTGNVLPLRLRERRPSRLPSCASTSPPAWEAEAAIRASGLHATILRPWYVLGPGRRWPLLLLPFYWTFSLIPSMRAGARRLGLVTVSQMVAALVRSVEWPSAGLQVLEVPQIRSSGLLTGFGAARSAPPHPES